MIEFPLVVWLLETERVKGLKYYCFIKTKSSKWAYDSYHLPKGVIESGETEKDTAVREILEETGYNVKIIKKLGSLESYYDDISGIRKKLTHYFLCEVLDRIGKPDWEHDSLRWVSVNEAIRLLSKFPIWENEEEIVQTLL